MKVIKKEPDKSVTRNIVCRSCGVTIEYVPIDVKKLWSGTDMGGGHDCAEGFICPECGKEVITKRW